MTSLPSRSSSPRSLPKILIELAPFTPESASSTLSRMSCEKPNVTPGKSAKRSLSSFSIDSRVVPCRQVSIGSRGTLNSRLKNPVRSVPSSGLPTCDMTPRTSGIEAITARSRGTIREAASKDDVRGRAARIQRFPSSSCGMNSLPMCPASTPVTITSPPRQAKTSQRAASALRSIQPNTALSIRSRIVSFSSATFTRRNEQSTGASVMAITNAPPIASA